MVNWYIRNVGTCTFMFMAMCIQTFLSRLPTTLALYFRKMLRQHNIFNMSVLLNIWLNETHKIDAAIIIALPMNKNRCIYKATNYIKNKQYNNAC